VTNIPIDKTNLTNFQRIYLDEKGLTQTANGIGHRNTQTSSSVFEVIHSLAMGDSVNTVETNQQKTVSQNGHIPFEQQTALSAAVVCNPLLLSIPSYEQSPANGSCNGNYRSSSNNSSGSTDGGFNSSMHINRMFDEAQEHVNIFFFKTKNETIDSRLTRFYYQ
jgi:hypothetical protein